KELGIFWMPAQLHVVGKTIVGAGDEVIGKIITFQRNNCIGATSINFSTALLWSLLRQIVFDFIAHQFVLANESGINFLEATGKNVTFAGPMDLVRVGLKPITDRRGEEVR